jgi:hypothetical protein
MQFFSPLVWNFRLFFNKKFAENFEYHREAMHKAKKMVSLLFRVTRELKIFGRPPIDSLFVAKLPHAVRKCVDIGMTREPTTCLMHCD